MLVQVVLTLVANWADIRHLSEIRRSGVGTQEARLGVELYLEDSEVVRAGKALGFNWVEISFRFLTKFSVCGQIDSGS